MDSEIGASAKKKILFVDDEPAVLDGLRAVLRSQRHDWDMIFALGGPAGVEALEKDAFDVIVTDMRMPIVDGAALLLRAKALQPKAVRLVLSGQADTQTAMKTVFTAHQFLAKPCDVQQLRSVVERACDLQRLISMDAVRDLAGDVSLLPVVPRSYLEISRVLADPRSNTSDVAKIIEHDPALCAKVLQVVNSAFFGLPRSVTSVAEASGFLGTLTLRNLALAMEAASPNASTRQLPPEQLKAFQANSLLVALIGRRWFAGRAQKADEVFAAGMLRELGSLLLATRRQVTTDEVAPSALSAYLLGLWGIPHAILEAVAFYDTPHRVAHEGIETVDVLHLADRIAGEMAPSPFRKAQLLDTDYFEARGVDAAKIESFRDEARELAKETLRLLAASSR